MTLTPLVIALLELIMPSLEPRVSNVSHSIRNSLGSRERNAPCCLLTSLENAIIVAC